MKTINTNKFIGVFDSGVGGLTVVKEIMNLLPKENIVYLGDTARVPYGNKSKETIIKYSIENTKFLLKHNIKLLVVACNTSSSYAIPSLKKMFKNLKIVDVVSTGAKAAVNSTKNNRIGVIGTKATIRSRAYEKKIKKYLKKAKIYAQATPLFVPLIEEGWIDKVYYEGKEYIRSINHENIIRQVSVEYLAPLKEKNIDVLILGCTHYPAIKMIIQDVMGKSVKVVDSAVETALVVKDILTKYKLLNDQNKTPSYKFFVTDDPKSFAKVGSLLLNKELKYVKKVNL
ncbi:MAG: glutamate racemase [Elusimicrobiota bacterium]|nr:glutamate racemase [Endomicrobiia bacterium]MDW8165999.1 glutamate racemase [Elusimicrobiota bacterium]